MKIGVPSEVHTGEKRVATTPEVIKFIQKLGYNVAVESGAGKKANFQTKPIKIQAKKSSLTQKHSGIHQILY